MSEHKATISWKRTSDDFLNGKYSREHRWTFDGGLSVPASPSPAVVPPPYSNPANVDPEEAYVAAIASCHMLTFLYLASQQGFQVDRYEDEAVGVMSKNEKGVAWISLVTSIPRSHTVGRSFPLLKMKRIYTISLTNSASSRIPSGRPSPSDDP
jgi:organic hydroperoxide reductase OsmC/OhrA